MKINRTGVIKSIAVASIVLLGGAANASLIVDNGTDTTNIGGSCSSCGDTNWQTFDDFVLTDTYTLNRLSIDFSTENYDNVEFSIWNDDLSTKLYSYQYDWTPGTFVTNVDEAYDNVTVNLDLGSTTLTADTYYISLWGTNTFVPRVGTGTHLQFKTGGLTDYSDKTPNTRNSDIHFRLYGNKTDPVPEPTTMLLFGTGLAGLAAVSRRRK